MSRTIHSIKNVSILIARELMRHLVTVIINKKAINNLYIYFIDNFDILK